MYSRQKQFFKLQSNTNFNFVLNAFLLTLFVFSDVLYYQAPLTLFSDNAYLVLSALLICCTTVYFSRQMQDLKLVVVFSGVIFCLIFLLNFSKGDGQPLLHKMMSQRSGYLLFIYMSYAYIFVRLFSEKALLLLEGLLTLNILVGVWHHFLDPTLNFYPAHAIKMLVSGRETGVLMSASIYGDTCVLYLLIIHYRQKFFKQNQLGLLRWGVVAMSVVGVLLSGSRYPLLFTMLILVMLMHREFKRNIMLAFTLTLACILMLYYEGGNAFSRLLHHSDSLRVAKDQLGLQLIFSSLGHFLFGVPESLVDNTFTSTGLLFSDNSYLTLVINYGFLLGTLLLYAFFRFLSRLSEQVPVLALLFLLFAFFETNSIFWGNWLLLFFMVYFSFSNGIAWQKEKGQLDEK